MLFHIACFYIFTNGCQPNQHSETLFQLLPAEKTNIHFVNEITEDDTHNILNFTNLYTGAGVGVGDFNNDGFPDLFFGGNMVSSRLYLNKGDLTFEDITISANVETDRWVMGVAVADINADGWQDIYLSVSGNASSEKRKNLLFINQKDNSFKEEAEKYGIADTSQCTHANFFDYDKDGDLDLFVIVNPTDYKLFNVNNIRQKKTNGEAKSTDKLYRNNANPRAINKKKDSTYFTDVSREAGILIEGYSLGLNTSDLNGDHWPDIYVTNDFLTNDIVYINNQDGTFTNQAAALLKHTSFASMGIDVADINNDGHPEIYVLDMFPEDNYRQKMIMPGGNIDRFNYILKTGYEPQYSRNTLQLNNGDGTYSEIGQLANVYQTDWSWSALLADYDNDGYRDLFVTNGFRRDLGNLDYINYSNTNAFGTPESQKKEQAAIIKKQPGAKLLNYIFKNKNGLTFSKKTIEWGLADSTYSHGAAIADLDLDGDLDLIINNNAQPAFIYENKASIITKNHFIQLKLTGSQHNPSALGAKVWLYSNNQIWFAEHSTYRGYESSVENSLHFGLGSVQNIDSIGILWTDGSFEKIINIPADTCLYLQQGASTKTYLPPKPSRQQEYFKEINPGIYHLNHRHQEDLQIDFKTQALLPHQHSLLGPPIAVGDINTDGLDDFFIGGSAGHPGCFFMQETNGTFKKNTFELNKEKENTACLLFDADGDHDLDLYLVNGGVIYSNNQNIYQDQLYFNHGNGNFELNENALPKMASSGASIAAEDFDKDGDIDLFIGGRVTPTQYPIIPESYLLENKNGTFKDITPTSLRHIGMVTSSIWTDYDKDGDKDLMLAGEFMPITFFKNETGQIQNTPLTIPQSNGWWNTLAAGDFDNDGDLDYLAGNLGLNTNYTASKKEPLRLYAKDFDKNGSLDPVLSHYIDGNAYPVHSRDQLIQQIPPIKVRFNNYDKYAKARFKDVFRRAELRGATILEAQFFENCFIENKGNETFDLKPLSSIMQLAPINKFLIDDYNGDGQLDAIAIGNNYSTEVTIGRYDAFTGAMMLGDGNGNFTVVRGAEMGMRADRDARDLVKVRTKFNEALYILSNNSDSLQLFIKK